MNAFGPTLTGPELLTTWQFHFSRGGETGDVVD